MKFSPSTIGWYADFQSYPSLPPDLIDVPDEIYRELQGKQIEAGPGGMPREYVPPLPDPRVALKAAVTAKRWEIETGGIAINGIRVSTTRESQNTIANAVTLAAAAGVEEVDFKAESGWVKLTIAQVTAIGAAIGLHQQACYSAERAHHEAIDALAEEDLAGYDVNAGWPT